MLSSAVALAAASFLALAPEVTLAPRSAASTGARPGIMELAAASGAVPLAAPSAPPASPPIAAPPPASPPPASPPSAAPPPSAPPPSSPPLTSAPPASPPTSAPPPSSPPLTSTPPVPPPSAPTEPSVTPPGGDAPPSAPPPSEGPPSSTDVTAPPSGELPPTDSTQAPADVAADPADTWERPPASVAPPKPNKLVPPPVPPPPTPPSGRGLLIGAAVVGGAGLVVRVLTTVSVARAIQHPDGLPMDTMIRGALFYDPLIAAGLGMAAGGMARRGRLDAHNELFAGMPPKRARRGKLGWGLFGAGLGTWAVTRIVGGTSCRGSDDCKARVWEVGYYLSLAGTIPGAILGGYASGFNGYHRRFGHIADVSLAPIASRQSWGLALSGRF